MTQEINLRKTDEVAHQNRESYLYLRSLVPDDGSVRQIDNGTTMRFIHPEYGFDRVQIIFAGPEESGLIIEERYEITSGGIGPFLGSPVETGIVPLRSGLRVQPTGFGRLLLAEGDEGVRTRAKVIADTIRAKLEALASPQS